MAKMNLRKTIDGTPRPRLRNLAFLIVFNPFQAELKNKNKKRLQLCKRFFDQTLVIAVGSKPLIYGSVYGAVCGTAHRWAP